MNEIIRRCDVLEMVMLCGSVGLESDGHEFAERFHILAKADHINGLMYIVGSREAMHVNVVPDAAKTYFH